MDDEEVEVETEALRSWVESLHIFSVELIRSQGGRVLNFLLESDHQPIKDMIVEFSG